MQPINILGLWDHRFLGVVICDDQNLQKLFESGQQFMTTPVMNDEGKLTGITLLAIDPSSVLVVEYNEILAENPPLSLNELRKTMNLPPIPSEEDNE